MSSIYLVITQTGSIVSKFLKLVTKKQYNHISLSLDGSLNSMYSFGRKWPYNPFIGVFVCEKINYGTYKRFKNTKCQVIKLEITNEQYESLRENINYVISEKEKYKYNVLGLLLAGLNIDYCRKYKFYCSQFVKWIMEKSNIDVSVLPKIAHPIDFLNFKNSKVIYQGLLSKYGGDINE